MSFFDEGFDVVLRMPAGHNGCNTSGVQNGCSVAACTQSGCTKNNCNKVGCPTS